MTTSYPPNLFQFAPGELSQDAMISWLLSWVQNPGSDHENASALRSAGVDLLDLLLRSGAGAPLSPRSRESALLTNLERQAGHADILADFSFEDRRSVHIVIEDKTNTSHHSKQLDRALRAGEEFIAEHPEVDLECVYFKTGWVHEGDRIGRPLKFGLLERSDVLTAMVKHRNSHPYLADWLAWLEEIDATEKRAREYALSDESIREAFESPVGLEAFARASFPSDDDCPARHMVEYFGTSRGRPWRTIEIYQAPLATAKHPDLPEVLFWRFDTRNGVPIASLRRYWKHDSKPEEKVTARSRFHAYLNRIEKLFAEREDLLGELVLGKRSAQSSTYREQEVIVLMMGAGDDLNSPTLVAGQLSVITRAIDEDLAAHPIPNEA